MTRAASFVLIALVTACTSTVPATGTIVELDAETGVRRDVAEIEIRVTGAGADGAVGTPREETLRGEDVVWPVRITIAPEGDDTTRTFSFEAIARDRSGTEIGTVRARSGFIARRTLLVPLVLEDCCRATTCDAEETCRSCGCSLAAIDPASLRDFDPILTRGDAAVPDAGAGDGSVRDAGPRDAFVPSDAGPECAVSTDCSDPRPVCNARGRCVECTAAEDVCGAGESCDEGTERCVLRCDGNDECVIPGAMHQSATCLAGACSYACDDGWGDCNDMAADGCEASLDSLTDCGACHAACTVPSGTGTCAGRVCRIDSCNPGRADCDGVVSTGCEIDTTIDPANCGACAASCAATSATTACVASSCAVVTCDPGRGNCDASAATGCETETESSFGNCGACGVSCALRGTSRECRASACATLGCQAGYTDCSAAVEGCEAYLQTDRNNCGACGRACGGGEACMNGGCCALALTHCPGVGCVDTGYDVANCGACGNRCASGLRCFDYDCVP